MSTPTKDAIRLKVAGQVRSDLLMRFQDEIWLDIRGGVLWAVQDQAYGWQEVQDQVWEDLNR